MSITYRNTSFCQTVQAASLNITRIINGIKGGIEAWEALIIILGTGVFASLLAVAFSYIRKHVYQDKNSLDTSFDAGGKVNVGLTATTVVSQWTWAATLLQSSTVGTKYGISGPFWYAAGATIQILLFSMLAVQIKIRAPGAKTFLQVIRARFGSMCHKVFCCFALITNIIVTSMLMLGAAGVITSLVKDMSIQYATTLVAATTGAYTIIGGLGATFYVSYFNTAIIYVVALVFLNKVYHDKSEDNPLGCITSVFDLVSCNVAPDGNLGNSYFTIISNQGLMFGIINIIGNFGTVFVDQSYWQSAVAAKPKQGVIGFLFGGIAWFSIPFTLATTMGMAYLALSTRQGAPLLTPDEIDAGLVPPIVAQALLGKSGELLMLVMVLMAVVSTGSAEVMAVTSILVYDVYAIYLKPYRLTTETNSCILCGRGRGRMANPRDKCNCQSMTKCSACYTDDKNRGECKRAVKPDYKCISHGNYRVYLDLLDGLKKWCLVIVSMCMIPLTIILDLAQLKLGWVYLFMGIIIGSCVIPITLAMFWDRLNATGMISGSILGTVLALMVWLSVASTYEGGLSIFLVNTGQEMSMLCGNLTSILAGGIITIVVSIVTNKHFSLMDSREIWENTRDIDNPLNPWTENFAKELKLTGAHHLDNRPSLEEVARTFKLARYLAIFGSIALTIGVIIIWPAIMVAVGVMDKHGFFNWVTLSEFWVYAATLSMILVPLINEIWDIVHTLKIKKQRISNDEISLVHEKHVTSASSSVKKRVPDKVAVNIIETSYQGSKKIVDASYSTKNNIETENDLNKLNYNNDISSHSKSSNQAQNNVITVGNENFDEHIVQSGYAIPPDTSRAPTPAAEVLESTSKAPIF